MDHLCRTWLWLSLIILVGCRPAATSPAPEKKDVSQPALRVLVVDDPELSRDIQRQWVAHGEQPLAARETTVEEFLATPPRRLAADVVIYPASFLGELAGRDWLQPLGDEVLNDAKYQYREIWEAIRLNETKWGTRTFAVPLGSPPLMLCYRQDIFQQLNLTPPQTWAEYQHHVERLSASPKSSNDQSSQPADWHATVEPLASGWAAELLLARAAPYARHPSQFSTLFEYSTMRPLIDGPPFVRALEELVAAHRANSAAATSEPTLVEQTPQQAAQMLLDGRCAMAITWIGTVEKGGNGKPAFPLAFAPLPHSSDVYNFRTKSWEQRVADATGVPLLSTSGRLVSVTKECRSQSAAIRLLQFVSGPELSAQISSASFHTTLFRESHLAEAQRWFSASLDPESAERYAQTLKEVLNQSNCLITLRIPGRNRYMTALDEAIRQAITEQKPAQPILQEVAKQWDAITDELGRENQRLAYVHSIGLE